MSLGSPAAEALLLGIAQDAGIPHVGCACRACADARRNPPRRQLPASLALIDRTTCASWLIDATPAFPEQLARLADHAPECAFAGILLTHAHIGHYTGLMYLGREALGARAVPVYATPALCAYLAANGPWSQLVALGNIVLHPISPGTPLQLSPALSVTALPVPHRAEFSDTVAYLVRGGSRALLYCPDIDRWDDWPAFPNLLATVDIALLDGTFFSAAELPGRDMREIPHPLVAHTARLLDGTRAEVVFIHVNHSNPLLYAGPERRWLRGLGMKLGGMGQRWILAELEQVAPTS